MVNVVGRGFLICVGGKVFNLAQRIFLICVGGKVFTLARRVTYEDRAWERAKIRFSR